MLAHRPYCQKHVEHLVFAAFAVFASFVLLMCTCQAKAFAERAATTGDLTEDAPLTWSDFRGSPTSNGVTDAETPAKKSDAGLKWAVGFADGYLSPQIIVGDKLVVTYGRGSQGTIAKLDMKTGKETAKAKMRGASTFSLIPPTYADGKLFVTLKDGSLEAFDAKTLKSLWFYQNKAGGQGKCPVVYSDGYVYTGYWSGDTAKRSFVCVNAKTGKLVWERANAGGYYWAGALAVGDYLLFGCDDGRPDNSPGASYVRCVNKRTGAEVSRVSVKGDQRSSIVYDADLGRVYFTSKPGMLYSAKLDTATGELTGFKSVKIDEQTTATPLVYDGRVYVGGSGGGFEKGSLSVIDAKSLELLYQLGSSAGVDGTVKSAPLVSTARMDGANGKLYLYFTVNNPPGGIKMLAVEAGSTRASQAKVTEVFTPPKALQQYCIGNVLSDERGNLYYRNDSNYLMCVGPGGTDPAKFKVPKNDGVTPGMQLPNSGNEESGNVSDNAGRKASDDEGGTNRTSDSTDSNSGKSRQGGSSADSGSAGTSGNSSADSSETRRSGPIQGGASQSGATARSSGTSGASQNSSSGSSSRSSSSATSSTSSSSSSSGSSSSVSSSASNSRSGSSGSEASQDDSTRHTDAQAATKRLDDAPENGTPAWFVPAAVVLVALISLVALIIARAVGSRRKAGESMGEDQGDSGTEKGTGAGAEAPKAPNGDSANRSGSLHE